MEDTPKSTSIPSHVVLLAVPGGNPDPDQNLRIAAAEGLPIRLRIQPTVLIGTNHTPLSSIRWIFDFPTEESVREFYTAMDDWVRGYVLAHGA